MSMWQYTPAWMLEPNKGNNMNEITEVTITPDVPFDLDVVEILDDKGNPTGEYRSRDVTSTATTIYTTAEDGEHEVVTVH